MYKLNSKIKFNKHIIRYISVLLFVAFSQTVFAQSISVTGSVSDNLGDLMPGVTVIVRGTTTGTTTDIKGEFSINVPSDTSVLQFRFIGYRMQETVVGNRRIFAVTMHEETAQLSEVVILAFGQAAKKGTEVAAVSSVRVDELKTPSSNLTTALAGRVAGMISYQRSGEPGLDNADFFIRGVTTFGYKQDPLILIDGIELTNNDLARLQVDDIASFSIMKDATATALYGARGANGVILVTTKEGREGKARINVRVENSFSQPTRRVELADPITFMNMHNEAVKTRNPLGSLPHSPEKIEHTKNNVNPYVFPAVDWFDMLFKDLAINQRFNASISGGGNIARYYVAGTYSRDQGNLKVDKRNNFNNNINLNKYVLRSNVNINVHKNTEVIVRLHATMDDYTGPIDGGSLTYRKIMQTSPVHYPAFYEPDAMHQYMDYVLFGNYESGWHINPYADMVRGYRQNKQALMLAQFELKQKLNFITEGLNFRAMFNTNRRSNYGINRQYIPYYFSVGTYDAKNDTYRLYSLDNYSGRDYLETTPGARDIVTTTYFESALTYDRTFKEVHGISGLMVFTMRDELTTTASANLQRSLPYRNMGLAGRFTYSYASRYFTEFNFGYNGSERFAEKERWGFFPSVGAGWIISNEDFWNESLKKTVSKLKVKASYGLVGNDAIGSVDERFFYLSEVNLRDTNYSYRFGEFWTTPSANVFINNPTVGVSISRYPNAGITWETSRKTNIGLEVGLFNKLEFQMDVYRDYRYNILMDRADVPSTFGLHTTRNLKANIGEAVSRGIDMSIDYNWSISRDLWFSTRANLTYATNEYTVYEEPDYSAIAPWRSSVGYPFHQRFGFVAERLFVDDAEVYNSPTQRFTGAYVDIPTMGGDLKYKDINGDGQISDLDKVPIGFPTSPEIVYGFGFSAG